MTALATRAEGEATKLAALLALLHERTGLDMPASRAATCERAVRRAMANASVRDLDEYRAVLDSDVAAFDALVDELTIGETYFFRDPRQLAFLRTVAIPDLVRRRAPGHVLSVWSAGCASGEEPYSLAILLHELGLAGRCRIVGTDLARRRLATARRARYGKWSLRGVAPEVVDRYFRRDGASFDLVPAIRAAVRYRYLNLAEEIGPDLPVGGLDLIVCRNVLIYFDAETIARVTQRLVERLADGGWLLLGPSDPPLLGAAGCEVVMTEAGLAYRRRAGRALVERDRRLPPPSGSREAPAARPPVAAAPPRAPRAPRVNEPAPAEPAAPAAPQDELAHARNAYAERAYDRAAAHAKRYVDAGGGDAHGWVVLVRALANAGHASAASLTCAAALEANPMSAELAVLQSMLLAELAQHDAATAAARRALYLDRDLVVAHLALGTAMVRGGDAPAARRAFANACRLLDALSPGAVVPASDGAPAAHLAAFARGQLQRLARGAP